MNKHLIIIALILLHSKDVFSQITPVISNFNISECKENCFIKADLISISNANDTLSIEAGINLNCCGDYQGNFEYWSGDTLNLKIENRPDESDILTSCNCNCYYIINYKISNTDSLPKVVLINGQTFIENRNDAGWIEPELRIKK